jgi:putative transposase
MPCRPFNTNSSLLKKSVNTIASPLIPSVIGPILEKSLLKLFNIIKEPHTFTIYIQLEQTFREIVIPRLYSREYYTLVFLAKNNNLTLTDKLKYFQIDTQTQKLFLISDPDSMTTDPAFANWWDSSVRDNSLKLWLPTQTESLDLDSTSLNNSVKKIMSDSWFSATKTTFSTLRTETPENYKKTSYPSSTSLSQDEMDVEQDNSKKPEPNSLRKIRLYPTEYQKYKLTQLFDSNRWSYNILNEKSQDKLFDMNIKISDLKKEIRPFVQKQSMDISDYIKESPEECFDSAFRDLIKARTTTLALSKSQKDKTGKGFVCDNLKYKKKKELYGSIEIRARSINIKENGIQIYPTFFKDEPIIRVKDDLPVIEYSIRLQKTIHNEYYICIPMYKPIQKSNTKKTCAIDPGVRTMLTGYDPEGEVFEIGTNIRDMEKRWVNIDRIQRILMEFRLKRNKRYNLRKEQKNTYKKVSNMVKDCHHKTSKWLSQRYNKILYPKFNVKQMINKKSRVLGRRTVRK